jgi:hypothetical protein
MRNVWTSNDHVSPYYYKYFLDSFVPIVLEVITMDEAPLTTRYEKA